MKKFFVVFVLCLTLFVNSISTIQAESMEDSDILSSTQDQAGSSDFFSFCKEYEIPRDELELMSTVDVLDKVLEFPYVGLFLFAYNDLETGLAVMKDQYGVYDVLTKRDDLQLALYSKYEELSAILDVPFTSQEKIDEVNDALYFISIIQNYECITTFATQENLFEINYSFAKNTYTPKGAPVALYSPERELNQEEQRYISEALERCTYSLKILATPTSKYNCHAYTWVKNNDRSSYWLEDPTKFLTDGSYSLESSPSIGSHVYYQPIYVNEELLYGNHSALVVQTASNTADFIVNSKWGCWGAYEHKLKNCGYYYSSSYIKFYDTPIRIGIKAFQRYINANLPSQYLGTPLVIDGNFGPASNLAAVKLLQYWLNQKYNAGLTIDGGFGTLTYNACVTVAQGDSGMGVYILQGLLYAHGYNPNGFDGSFGVNGGTGCLNAVKAFQSAKGLTVDGRAGRNTFKALCT